MKKIMIVALLVSSMFFNTACTDEEVAASIIGIGVGIAIAVGDDGHHDRPPDRYPGPDYGRPRPGYPGYGPGPGRPHRGYSADVKLASSDAFDTSVEVLDFANKYGVSTETAAKIQDAFVNVRTQGVSSFEAIGLSKADLKAIAQREMPQEESLQAFSQKLDLSEAQARDLIKTLIKDFDAQASNVESNYWQSCMAKGQWRTPQNAFCKSTSWQGCAPVTGASLCY